MDKGIKTISMRSLAVFLSIVMILTALPLYAFAVTIDTDIQESIPENVSESSGYERKKDIFELEDRREETVKHFRLEDGTSMAVQYGKPIHELNQDGKWEDIDNTLLSSGTDYSTPKARVKFSKQITGSNRVFTLHENNRKITLALSGANKKAIGKIVDNNVENGEQTQLQKLMTLDKLSSRIIYEDILDDVDIEYVIESKDIKENIIVKSPKDLYTYSFALSLNNLQAELRDSGEISIFDPLTGDIVYIIPNGFMYDANGERSDAVAYTLTDNGNGSYYMAVSADSAWINDANRAFPITIDPSVSVPASTVTDLDISLNSPNRSSPNDTTMYVSEKWRSYWRTNTLPNLPDSAYIVNAAISLYTASTNSNYIGVYNITTNWASDLTWNKTIAATNPQGVMSASVIDYNHTDGTSAVDHRYTWNITSLVKSWYSGTANYGIGFKIVDGTTSTANTSFSSTQATVACRPQFVITYKDMKGVEPYWSYVSQDAGLAGTGSVNVATGNLTFVKPLLSTTDSLMPFTPTLIYNSALSAREYKYPNVQISYWGSYSPMGFKLNIQETLIKKSYTSTDGTNVYYYIWADADGTEHAFMPVEGSTTEYADEDGLQLKLIREDGVFKLTDDSKTVKTFSRLSSTPGGDVYEGWYLTSITDKNGNAILFTFTSGPNPSKVSLKPSVGLSVDYLRIQYHNYLPAYIINDVTKEAIVFQYSETPTGSISRTFPKYLRKLIYARDTGEATDQDWMNYYNGTSTNRITVDTSVEYNYNAGGYLTKATDKLSDYYLSYTFSGGKVSNVREYGRNTLGQRIGITYYSGYSEVRNSGSDDLYGNSDDLVTRYTFDGEGRSISAYSYNADESKIYGATIGQYSQLEEAKNKIKSTTVVGGSQSNYIVNGGFENLDNGFPTYWNRSSEQNVNYIQQSVPQENFDQITARFIMNPGQTENIHQFTKLPSGTYTLSMYVDCDNCDDISIYAIAQSIDDPAHIYTEQIPTTAFSNANSLVPFSMSFEAADIGSTEYESFKIMIKAVRASGSSTTTEYVEIDNVMLSKGLGMPEFNLVQMGSFDSFNIRSNGEILANRAYFWENENGYVDLSSADSPFNVAGAVYADIDSEKYIAQTVYQGKGLYSLYAGSVESKRYTVSGFAKGTGQVSNPNATFRLRVEIKYYRGNNIQDDTVNYCYDFSKDCNDWQFTAGEFSTESCRLIRSIKVYCEYSYQPNGVALFDDISIIEQTGNNRIEREYYGEELDFDHRAPNDNLNGLLRSEYTENKGTFYEYDNDRRITRIANDNGELWDYEYYPDSDNIKYITHYNFLCDGNPWYPCYNNNPDSLIIKQPDTRTEYRYNAWGLPTLEVTYKVVANGNSIVKDQSTPIVYSSKEYHLTTGPALLGRIKCETDSLGNETKYYYDTTNGRLIGEIRVDREGSGYGGVYYTYDAVGRLKFVRPATRVILNLSQDTLQEVTDQEHVEYTYDLSNNLEYIYTDTTSYYFQYDAFHNPTSISVGNVDLAEYEYNQRNGKLNKITYGNGFIVRYVYDRLDNIKEVWYTEVGEPEIKAYEYTYTVNGQLYRYDDFLEGKSTVFVYDSMGRLIRNVYSDTEYPENMVDTTLGYVDGELSEVYHTIGYSTETVNNSYYLLYSYVYNEDGSLDFFDIYGQNDGLNISIDYDIYKRIASKTVSGHEGNFENTVKYEYLNNSSNSKTSALVEIFRSQVGSNAETELHYTYDGSGNITSISQDETVKNRYVYDDMGQLVREDNTVLNKTYTYKYDNAGNILSKNTYPLTDITVELEDEDAINTNQYCYGNESWGDLLTSFNGQTITYDEIGNPLSYYNGSRYTFTWEGGRRLASATKGTTNISYTYNDEGIRTEKTVNGTKHIYYLSGSQILAEEVDSVIYIYFYDENGSPIGMQTRSSTMAEDEFYTFWFEKNLQGDIIAVYNDLGQKVCSYTYDAWGNCTSTLYTVGVWTAIVHNNPFRYRGYYLDAETGLYYLNSRYYDPNTGRFINADTTDVLTATPEALTDKNLFAYCDNNPIIRKDDGGRFWNLIIGGIVGAVVGGVVAGVTSYIQSGSVDWGSVLINTAVGAASGVIAATGLGAFAQAGLTAVVSGAGNALEQVHTNKGLENFNAKDVITSSFVGGATSLLGTGLGKVVGKNTAQASNDLLNQAKDKLLTGYVRQSLGQSSSAFMRQGSKLVAQATIKQNLFRGISSVVGSLAGAATGTGYSMIKRKVMGW